MPQCPSFDFEIDYSCGLNQNDYMKPGWHSRGYLPHFDEPNMVQSITFRLADSLPKRVVDAWQEELATESDADRRIEILSRSHLYLDGSYGQCLLRQPELAQIVEDSLLHFDSERYLLLAWVIMPNHVHVLVEISDDELMSNVVWGWKAFTARQINQRLGRSGRIWQREYFDRYIRNTEHLHNAVQYIEQNPVKSRLVRNANEYRWSSARYRTSFID
jgi:putative DNA methylase